MVTLTQVTNTAKLPDESKRGESIAVGEHKLIYYPDFWNDRAVECTMRCFLEELPWQAEKVKMYGKEIKCKRETVLYGNDYDYGGTPHAGLPMPTKVQRANSFDDRLPRVTDLFILTLQEQVESLTGRKFDSMLFNLYPDGEAGIGWHKDKGDPMLVASLSIGAERTYCLRQSEARNLCFHLHLQTAAF